MKALRGFFAVARGLVFRPVMREKIRTILTILGIAVGVSVLVAIQLSNASALRAFGESVDAVAGRATFVLVSDSGMLDEKALGALQPLWALGVRFAPVLDLEGVVEPSRIPIRILAVDLLSDLHFRDYRYAQIDTPGPAADSSSGLQVLSQGVTQSSAASFISLFRRDSIVLPQSFASSQGFAVGDSITLDVLGESRRFVIRGLLQPQGPATAFDGSLAVMDIATAQSAFGLRGRLSRIDLMVPDSAIAETERLAASAISGTTLERPSRRNERVGEMLRAFRINLFALAGVALLVGIFLVYNTVLISILRRSADVGVLRTLGASPGQIFSAFVAEGAVFGIAGSLLGLALGYGLAYATLEMIGRTINSLYVATSPSQIILTPALIVVAILLGTGVSVLSAVQPALEAASIRPNVLIRAGIYQRAVSPRVMKGAAAAVVLFILGSVIAQLPPVGGISVAGYVAVTLIVAGFAAIAPLAILLLSRAARGPFGRMFRLPGTLAAASMPASLRRVAVAAAALSIAIGMMVAVSMMVGSFRETVSAWVDQTVRSDLWIRPAQALGPTPGAVFPASISDDLREIEEIELFDRIRMREIVFRDSLISVGGGDFAAAARSSAMPMVKPRSQARAVRDALRVGGVLVSESLSLKFDLDVGQKIEIPVEGGTTSFPITGIYRDYSNDRGVVVMDRGKFIEAYGDDTIDTIAIFLRKGVDPEAARAKIERTLGAKYKVFAFMNSTIRTEVMRIFDQTFLITYALLVVSIAVAVLGIINTLAALIIERRREIALLKVLGMSRVQIRNMILLECSLLGLVSSILGLACGFVLSWILIFVINRQSFGWTIEFAPPIGLVAASLAITLIATILAGIYPARMADRLEMSPALKGE